VTSTTASPCVPCRTLVGGQHGDRQRRGGGHPDPGRDHGDVTGGGDETLGPGAPGQGYRVRGYGVADADPALGQFKQPDRPPDPVYASGSHVLSSFARQTSSRTILV
jgi:hypothetical protein